MWQYFYLCCAQLWLELSVSQLPWTQLLHNFWSASVPKLHVSLPSQCWLQHKLDSSNTCSNSELSPVSGGWSSNAPISVRIVTLWSRMWWQRKPIFQFKKGGRRGNPPASTCHPLLLTEGEGRMLIFARHKFNHVLDLEIKIKVCNATTGTFSFTVNFDPVISSASWKSNCNAS